MSEHKLNRKCRKSTELHNEINKREMAGENKKSLNVDPSRRIN